LPVATSSNPRAGRDGDRTGFLSRPADDPMLERTEDLLRSLRGCGSVEQAAAFLAERLPDLVGADWASFSPAQGAVDRAHGFLAAAALADACVYSQGEPPTVAAVPVLAAGVAVGAILIGRRAGLCTPQLRTVALCAEHAGTVAPSISLAQTA
jgi:hypothetical protein